MYPLFSCFCRMHLLFLILPLMFLFAILSAFFLALFPPILLPFILFFISLILSPIIKLQILGVIGGKIWGIVSSRNLNFIKIKDLLMFFKHFFYVLFCTSQNYKHKNSFSRQLQKLENKVVHVQKSNVICACGSIHSHLL